MFVPMYQSSSTPTNSFLHINECALEIGVGWFKRSSPNISPRNVDIWADRMAIDVRCLNSNRASTQPLYSTILDSALILMAGILFDVRFLSVSPESYSNSRFMYPNYHLDEPQLVRCVQPMEYTRYPSLPTMQPYKESKVTLSKTLVTPPQLTNHTSIDPRNDSTFPRFKHYEARLHLEQSPR